MSDIATVLNVAIGLVAVIIGMALAFGPNKEHIVVSLLKMMVCDHSITGPA